MILCDKTLEVLQKLITDDEGRIQYRTGSKLVEFFNKLGFCDTYGQGFPSRGSYVKDKLQKINGTPEIDTCIKNLFSPVNFIGKADVLQSVLAEFNQYLSYDGWSVVVQGREVIIKKADGFELHTNEKVAVSKSEFLAKQFDEVDFNLLNLEGVLIPILQQRLDEIKLCMNAGASLSVIFLCGSTLEGVLVGIAQKHPKEFNTANSVPKDSEGKVRLFYNWSLASLIDVACEKGFIDKDVKEFSHVLRDFRNYIHPYEQMVHRFNPTEETAKICLQVLKGALNQLVKSSWHKSE